MSQFTDQLLNDLVNITSYDIVVVGELKTTLLNFSSSDIMKLKIRLNVIDTIANKELSRRAGL